jgi:Zn-finger nucleic acid-binding protein
MQQLLCPKCHNVMHQYERNGVTVDQCTECKGLFLDRGELEKLVAAETSWYGGSAAPPQPGYEPRYEPRHEERYEERRYDPRYRRHDDDHRYRKKDRRRSFLEELFD